jgi:corrinoid protein of di/trimethylamine methyltransferase
MEAIKKLMDAVVEGEEEIAAEAAQEIIDNEGDLDEVVANLTDVMRDLGEKFENFEIFLPQMLLSSDAMMAAMDVIKPVLIEQGTNKQKGKVVIGTAAGDMHEIGKDIVRTVLNADGFEVVDLGPDVNSLEFVSKANEMGADIIAISSLMTTTMPGAKEVLEVLNDKGIREKFKVLVGGAPTNKTWAEESGFDGWAENASDAVRLANSLVGGEK